MNTNEDDCQTSQRPLQPDSLEEYKDASANMRQYGNMRFAHLALFMVAMACLLRTVFPPAQGVPPGIVVTTKAAGIVLALVFGVLHHRAVCHFNHYRRRAVELEGLLGFKQHSTRNENTWIKAATVLWFVYLGFVVLWAVALYQEAMPPMASN